MGSVISYLNLVSLYVDYDFIFRILLRGEIYWMGSVRYGYWVELSIWRFILSTCWSLSCLHAMDSVVPKSVCLIIHCIVLTMCFQIM